jgi:hypothetical protein
MTRGNKPYKILNQAFQGRNSSFRIYTRMKVHGTNAFDKAGKSGPVLIASLEDAKTTKPPHKLHKPKVNE